MVKGLTLEQLQNKGAKPVGGLTLSQLQSKGAQPLSPQPVDNRNLLQKGADFAEKYIPGAQLGKAVGTSVRGLVEAVLTRSMAPIDEANRINNENYGRVVGDVIEAIAAPASLAVGGGSLPVQAAKFAATGGAASLGSSLAEGNNLKTAAKDAALGGAVSAAIPGAAKVLSSTGKAISQALPKRLMQSAIGQSKAELLAGKDVSEFALKKWKVGSPAKLVKDANAAIETLNTQIQHNLDVVAPKTARLLSSEISSGVVQKINAAGGAIEAKEVATVVQNLAPQAHALLAKKSLSLTEANKLRQALDKTLGDRGFLVSQLPFNKEILRAFGDVLREKVKTLAPAGTRALFNEMSKEITLRNAVSKKYAGQASNQVLNAFDIMLAGGGFLGGGPVGAAATVAAKKVAQSATGKTLPAVALNQLEKLTPVFATLAPAQKAVLIEVIANLLDDPEAQAQEKSTNPPPQQ